MGDHARRASARGGGTLVLIGDPKQAIYAFRGADVYAYLEAARERRRAARRSASTGAATSALLDAYDALFGGARLGHPGIVYRTVRAAAGEPARRGCGRARDDAAAGPRRRAATTRPCALTDKGFAAKDGALRHIARDLAARRRRPAGLGGDGRAARRRGIAAPRADRARPRRRARAHEPHRGAHARRAARGRVPAVVSGAGQRLRDGRGARWLDLLKAIERPASRAAGALGGADVVLRLERRRTSRAPRSARGRRSTPPARVGPRAAHDAASRR